MKVLILAGGLVTRLSEETLGKLFHNPDLAVDLSANRNDILERNAEPWRVTLVDTDDQTQTGGRLAWVRRFLQDEDGLRRA